MALSIIAMNLMLDALGAAGGFISLHTDAPGDSGANEVSGGAPAYARQSLNWIAAAAGTLNKDATIITFDVPASTEVKFLGIWSAATGGDFYGWAPIEGGDVAGVATVATDDTWTSFAHGLSDTEQVILNSVNGALPVGVSEDTLYYVINATTDTFQVSATLGGSAIDITTAGEARFARVTPQVFAVQGTLPVDTVALNLTA